MHISSQPRRQFLRDAFGVGAMLALSSPPSVLGAGQAPDRVRVAVIGLGRGMDHVQSYLQIPAVEIAAVSDVDERRMAAAVQRIESKSGRKPRTERDFRRLLADPTIHAVSIAMPNFWHAPATILACSAGKHVYVEKPGSHNAHEARLMVAAARKYGRRVQMGNQRRSVPEIAEAIARVHAGEIGPVRFARCWYDSARPGIGRGRPAPIPAWLDYRLWQGPVPEKPYVDNLVHYNWHWRWHWGGGELANNGIHSLDLARWGLKVEYPKQVTFNGSRYYFDDDQETPDTGVATFDFGHCGASWDNSSCSERKEESHAFVTFYGDAGSLAINWGAGYKVFDPHGKELRAVNGKFSDLPHFTNFIDSIQSDARLNSEIGEGQKSTMLCHLGNIAYRTGRSVRVNPATGELDHAGTEAKHLWRRSYRPGWEPKV
jgi:predicted dehydrogenase